MLHSLDNYSTYVDPETKEEFDRTTKQVFIGVGIQIQKDVGRDLVRVSTPLRGSPAYKAGIRAGDLIVKVTNTVDKEGKPLDKPEVTDTKGMTISDVVKKILGKEGTPVTLTIERETAEGVKLMDFTLTRGRIEVETMFGVKRHGDDSWEFYIDKENKIAYVRLNQFAQFTDRDLRGVLRELEKTGINGFILDLRFNPGGYLNSAVQISDLFVDDGLIVSIRPREGRGQEFKGRRDGTYSNFPLVVLVNNGSASASEIVSAAIQDHGRGIIMGERSFGKGSVQNIIDIDLGDGESEVKLTTASFWRPNGKNLNKFPTSKEEDDWGVVPHTDYTLKMNTVQRGELFDHLRSIEIIHRKDHPNPPPPSKYEDKQLDMAVQYLRRQITAKPAEKKAG
jgi:carboxyl-terminal processing protease